MEEQSSEPWFKHHGLSKKHYNIIMINIAQTLYDRGLHPSEEDNLIEMEDEEEGGGGGITGEPEEEKKKPKKKPKHKKTLEGSYSIMAQFLNSDEKRVDALMVGRVGKAVGVGDIRACFGHYARPRDLHHLIIISVGKVTPLGKALLASEQPFKCQNLPHSSLLFLVVTHDIVPKHRLLSDPEATEYLTENNQSREEMAEIMTSDPVSRHYDARVDQIFRIFPRSSTTGTALKHRVVRPAQVSKSNSSRKQKKGR